jgi:hypothetical protein
MPKDRHDRLPRSKRCLSVVVASVVLSAGPSVAQDTPLAAEALVANWKKLQDIDRTTRSYRVSQRNALDSKKPPVALTVKVRPDRWLFTADFEGTASVFSYSPSYSFLLWRTPGNPGWVLRTYEDGPTGSVPNGGTVAEPTRGEAATGQLRVCRPLGTLYTLPQQDKQDPTLYEMSQSPNFRLVRITREGKLDKVEFEYAGTSGVLLTDRSLSSVAVQSRVQGSSNSPKSKPWVVEMTGREVDRDAAGRLCCRRIEFVAGKVGVAPGQHEVYEFSNYSNDPIPDDEFTLSHYGLPEPAGRETNKGIPNSVWLLLGAGAFGLTAVVLRYAAKRAGKGIGTGANK